MIILRVTVMGNKISRAEIYVSGRVQGVFFRAYT